MRAPLFLVLLTVVVGLLSGACGGDARVELAAADALDVAAAQLRQALAEYTNEIEQADLAREANAVKAFVSRLQTDADKPDAIQVHIDKFTQALGALRADTRVEWGRYHTAVDNLGAVEEISGSLRRVAVETLTVSDEVRRYLASLLEARRRARSTQQEAPR